MMAPSTFRMNCLFLTGSLLLVVAVSGFGPAQPWVAVPSSSKSFSRLPLSSRTFRRPPPCCRMSAANRVSDNMLPEDHRLDSQHESRTLPRNRSVFSSYTRRVLSLTAAVALSSAAASLLMPVLPAAAVMDLSSAVRGATPVWLSSWSDTGFYQAFSLVFLSEIGDKTFFIAGLLSAKTSRLISFVGSMAALAAMTLVSVGIGQVFHAVPDGFANGFPLDDLAACLAFLFFGIKTLKEAWAMEPGQSIMDEELADAQEAVEGSESVKQETPWGQLASIFALVFAAEFGDRSFLSTIALSAAQNPVAVAGGAIAAHGVATGIAVSGGAVLAKYLSERVLGFIGGTLFIVFAVTTGLGIF